MWSRYGNGRPSIRLGCGSSTRWIWSSWWRVEIYWGCLVYWFLMAGDNFYLVLEIWGLSFLGSGMCGIGG